MDMDLNVDMTPQQHTIYHSTQNMDCENPIHPKSYPPVVYPSTHQVVEPSEDEMASMGCYYGTPQLSSNWTQYIQSALLTGRWQAQGGHF